MAYSTALEEEEEAGWQCCMPPRGSFGVLSPSQGAAEGVRNRDNPPCPWSFRGPPLRLRFSTLANGRQATVLPYLAGGERMNSSLGRQTVAIW